MAKTQLEIEGKGWEEIIDQMGKALGVGNELVKKNKDVGDAMEDAAKRSLAAQTQANAVLQKNGEELQKNTAFLKEAAAASAVNAKSVETVQQKLALATFAAKGFNAQQQQIRADAQKVSDAISAGNISQEEGLATLKKLGVEYANNAEEITKINVATKELNKSLTSADAPSKTVSKNLTGLSGLFSKISSGAKDIATKVGGTFKSLGEGASKLAGSVPVVGEFLVALGPVGVAVGAVAGGLFKVIENTNAGHQAIEGLGKAGGIVFDKITGAVKSVYNYLTDTNTVIGKVFSALETVFVKFNPIVIGLKALFGESIEEGQRFAAMEEEINRQQNKLTESDAKRQQTITKLSIQLRDQTRSEQDRIKIAQQIGVEERARAADEEKQILRRQELLQQEIDLQKKGKNEIDPDKEKALAEINAELTNAATASIELTERTTNRINLVIQEASAKRLAAFEAEIAERKQLAEDLAKFEEQLRLNAASAQQSGAIAALEEKADAAAKAKDFDAELKYQQQILLLKSEAAQQDIDLIQKTLQRKIALQQVELSMGKVAFDKLTQAQKDALSDRLIAEGKANLSEVQMAQVKIMRDTAGAEYDRQYTKAIVDNAAERVAASDAELKSELNIIDLQHQLNDQRLQNQGATDKAILVELIDFTKKKIALLESADNKTPADILNIDIIKAQLDKLQQDLKKRPPLIDWSKLLDIKGDDLKDFEDVVKGALNSASKAITNSLFTARISQIDAYISKLQESVSETEQAIEREQKAQDDGLANNLDAEKAHQEQLMKLEKDASKERAKIAKEQQVADALASESGAILSVVNLIERGTASAGVIGLAIAAASIPLIFSLINAAKSQAAAAFYQGTDYVQLGANPRGRDTVPAMLNEGEAVIRTEDNRKHRKLIKGLHLGDRSLLGAGLAGVALHYGIAADELVEKYGMDATAKLLPQLPTHIPVQMRETISRIEQLDAQAASANLEQHLRAIVATTTELVQLDKDRPTVIPLGNGKYRLVHGNVTKTVTVTGDA